MNVQTNESLNDSRASPILLSDRLRAATHSMHEKVDRAIMAAKPFETVGRYGRFLSVQHGIHRDVQPLYSSTTLAGLFPGLNERSRLAAVEQDLADLGLKAPDYTQPPATDTAPPLDTPEALGWLYVVEGSNLGAAFLLKYAMDLGLSEGHGARHLAAPPQGRAPSWKAFKGALNAFDLSEAEVLRAIAAADTAFARVQRLIGHHFP